jgi:hypothetical protein
MPTSPLNVLAERLESVTELDGPARTAGRIVRGLISDGASKNVLSGAWLGHALHPIMTDVPIGVWTSAVRRSGLVHAAANGTATALMISSYVARKRDRRGRGRLLSLAGSGALGAGGWLGGHLSYTLGAASRPAGHRPGRPQRKPGELSERPRGCGGRAVRARRLPASAEKGTPSRVPPRPNGTRLRKWSSRDARYSRAAARGCPQARALLSRGCLDGIGPVNTI